MNDAHTEPGQPVETGTCPAHPADAPDATPPIPAGTAPEQESPASTPHAYVCCVRYGSYHFRESFNTSDPTLRAGDAVVIRSPRDVEVGRVVAAARPKEEGEATSGVVLRRLTERDRARAADLDERSRTQLWPFVQEKAAELKLNLQLVDIEHLLGEQKVVVHYTADGRIDFRELVHMLARRFRARIEMRQIGPRDCTRIHGGIGTCGLSLCCATYLNRMEPVTIRMAKEQGQPLNPGKNCGVCGKLKCCLRYELEPDSLDSLKRARRGGRR